MIHRRVTPIGLMFVLIAAAQGQPADLSGVQWQQGPSVGDLGSVAEVHVPAGYVFVGGKGTRLLMEAMQNTTDGTEVGLVGPTGLDWFVVFEFDAVGYVRDDEKGTLDADAMLESIQRATAAENKERQRRGWSTMTILGWEQRPHYNETTHNLEWSIKAESEGHPIVNHNTRLLGREGVMRVTLVADPNVLPSTLPKFKDLLDGYSFTKGHKYMEFRPGDKIAKYGLSALVVGGATAVAVKTGLFKWLWKGLVVVVVAVGASVKRLFSRKKSMQVGE